MKFSLAILAFAAAASAQQVTGCDGKAQPCIEDAIVNSGVCDAGDYACGCANLEAIQDDAAPCVIAACDNNIVKALGVLAEVEQICAEIGA